MLVIATRRATKVRRVGADERPQFVWARTSHAKEMTTAPHPVLEPLTMDIKDEDNQSTLELLEALLLECGSEGSDASVEDQAIEEFANEFDLDDVDGNNNESVRPVCSVTGWRKVDLM